MVKPNLPDFDYKAGAFVNKKDAAAERMLFVTEYLMPDKAVRLEGSKREYRLYFPKLSRYFWPENSSDWIAEEHRLVREYRSLLASTGS